MFPQQIRVLQCNECEMYQVDIVKKANKWQCKLCNVKQLVCKEFLRGTGPECRAKAQQLNSNRADQQLSDEQQALKLLDEVAADGVDIFDQSNYTAHNRPVRSQQASKWATYVVGDEDEPKSAAEHSSISIASKGSNDSSVRNRAATSHLDDIQRQDRTSIKRQRPGTDSQTNAKKANSKWQSFM